MRRRPGSMKPSGDAIQASFGCGRAGIDEQTDCQIHEPHLREGRFTRKREMVPAREILHCLRWYPHDGDAVGLRRCVLASLRQSL